MRVHIVRSLMTSARMVCATAVCTCLSLLVASALAQNNPIDGGQPLHEGPTIAFAFCRDTGDFGIDQGPSIAEAFERALRRCGAMSRRTHCCEITLTVQVNRCGAVAVTPSGELFFAGGPTPADVRQRALERCGGRCSKVEAQCFTR